MKRCMYYINSFPPVIKFALGHKQKKTKKQKNKKKNWAKIHGKTSDTNNFLLLFFFRRFNNHGLSCENSQGHQIKEEKQKEEEWGYIPKWLS